MTRRGRPPDVVGSKLKPPAGAASVARRGRNPFQRMRAPACAQVRRMPLDAALHRAVVLGWGDTCCDTAIAEVSRRRPVDAGIWRKDWLNCRRAPRCGAGRAAQANRQHKRSAQVKKSAKHVSRTLRSSAFPVGGPARSGLMRLAGTFDANAVPCCWICIQIRKDRKQSAAMTSDCFQYRSNLPAQAARAADDHYTPQRGQIWPWPAR